MKKTTPISFRIREDIKAELQRLAAEDRRSLSSYIELALEGHLQRIKAEASAQQKRTRR